MFFTDLIFALLIAMAITAIFAVVLRRRGPWPSVWMFFVIIFLAAWAGSLWIIAAGPVLFGVPWVTLIIVGLLIAVLLAASAPARHPMSMKEAARKKEQVEETEEAFNLFFWVLMVLLILAVFFGYYATPRAF